MYRKVKSFYRDIGTEVLKGILYQSLNKIKIKLKIKTP